MNESIIAFAGDGGHEDRHFGLVLFVAIDVVAEAGAGHDFQVVRRANGVAELEVAVAGNAEVGLQLIVRELAEPARRASRRVGRVHVRKEVFQEPHLNTLVAGGREIL